MADRQEQAVMITGVSREGGIGAALARRFAANGARLFLTGWSPHDEDQPWGADPGGGQRLCDELRENGAVVEYVSIDLTDPDAPRRLMAPARAALGHVDALVANHARSSQQSLSE